MARRDYEGNSVPAALSGGINGTDLSISISVATGWPAGGGNGKFFITINRGLSTEERILVASRSGTTLTVSGLGDRGVDGTTIHSHSAGSVVEHTFSGVDGDEANAHVNDDSLHMTNAEHDIEARHTFGAAYGTPATPADIATAAGTGSGNNPAREDHVHKIGTGGINSAGMFAAGVVDAAAIGADAVGTSEIAPDAVGTSELAPNAATTTEIADNAVTQAKMADNAIGPAELAALAVTNAKLAADAVTTDKILAGTILGADIADTTIALIKMASEAATTYVPTYTGITVGGAGAINLGRYYKIGRIVFGWVSLTIGAGGNVTGDIDVSLPVAAGNHGVNYVCAIRGYDISANIRASGLGIIQPAGTTGVNFGTLGSGQWDGTNPWNWDPSDSMNFLFVYEAAA